MKKSLIFLTLLLMGVSCTKTPGNGEDEKYFREVKSSSSKYVSKVIEYKPAPGQFINEYMGNKAAAQSIVGGTEGLVSLGGFGGYIVFMFDHTVLNKSGFDFQILSNAFSNSSEPGIVMVAYDRNGNGQPDEDEWYELWGSAHTASNTVFNYTITYTKPSDLTVPTDIAWTDSQGGSGTITANVFNQDHSYFPLFFETGNTLSFTGTKLMPNVITGTNENGYGTLGKGYADNFSDEYTFQTGNGFDISNARDRDGNLVVLKGIDFVKVYTGVNYCFDNIGEASTEIRGAISLSVKK